MMMDSISLLPDEVAQHILSFLKITHLARFGCVSKRCRELYMSAALLDFDFPHALVSTCDKRKDLFNRLDRFFFRRGITKIVYFRVRWLPHDILSEELCCEDEHFRIMSWVYNALSCNVEELELDFDGSYAWCTVFPTSVFLCKSLMSLTVDASYMFIIAPSISFASNLIYLELKYGTIEEEFFKWISCCCKFIQELILQEIFARNIIIESSSLEMFRFDGGDWTDLIKISAEKLEKVVIDWLVDSPSNKSINIIAPNLRYLTWNGNMMNHQNLGKLESVQEAIIFLDPKQDLVGSVSEVLCCLSAVKKLFLNERTIKAMFREGSMPAPMENVHYLCLKFGTFVDELVPTLAFLFKGMPNLRALKIMSEPDQHDPESNTSGFDVRYWNTQNLSFDKLVDVTISLYDEEPNGMNLAKYMMKTAKNLKKLWVNHCSRKS